MAIAIAAYGYVKLWSVILMDAELLKLNFSIYLCVNV